MEEGLVAFTEQAKQQGWTVRTAAIQGAGWPLAADVELADLSITAGADVLPGGAVWRAERVVLHLSPFAPGVLEIRVAGVQHASAFGSPSVHFTADRFVLTTALNRPGPVALDAAQLRFREPLTAMTVGLLNAEARPSGGFSVTAEAISLPPPPAAQPALGRHIASVTMQGQIIGALPPPSPDAAARAAAWQRAGGSVQVTHLALGWGPLGVTGSVVLGLDEALQPAGTADLRVVGYAGALTALSSGGVLAASTAQAIGAVLALLAHAPAGGGVPQVDLPVALHDGTLTVGRIPVGKLPPVVWPTGP